MEIAEELWLSAMDELTAAVPMHHKKTVSARLDAYRSGKSSPIAHTEMMRKLRAR